MKLLKHTVTSGDAARALGVSVVRVHQLDDELEPIRLENGHRRYDPAVVERVAKQREGNR